MINDLTIFGHCTAGALLATSFVWIVGHSENAAQHYSREVAVTPTKTSPPSPALNIQFAARCATSSDVDCLGVSAFLIQKALDL
jgi:hypothetical protein